VVLSGAKCAPGNIVLSALRWRHLKAYEWNGKELMERFSVDFYPEKLGRPHVMRFGAFEWYQLGTPPSVPGV
jgi:hypothetical protein